MNQTIRLLAEQAYTEVMHEHGGRYMAFDKEKFAELLIFECIKIAVFKGDSETAKAIKEHFAL